MKHNNNNNPLRFPLLFIFLTCVRCCTPPTFFLRWTWVIALLSSSSSSLGEREKKTKKEEEEFSVIKFCGRARWSCVAFTAPETISLCCFSLFLDPPTWGAAWVFYFYIFPCAHPHHHHQFSRSSGEIRWPTAKEENVVVAVLFHFGSFPPPPLRFILKEP